MSNRLGGPLTDADYHKLEMESWITRELADAAGIFRVTSQQGADTVGRKNDRDYSGTVFPYIDPGTDHIHAYRLRRDHPELEIQPNGEHKEKDKYLTAWGDRNRLYFPPGVTLEMLADNLLPVIIVEGEKKTLALWRLSMLDTQMPRFLPVGISGVWNWRGTVSKEPGPDGKLYAVKGPIPDLDRVNWKHRKAIILMDSDIARNPKLKDSRRRLAEELERRQ
jgi:hypothetical protein